MKRASSFFQKHYFGIGLCFALCVAFLLRVFKLSTLPNFIQVDEATLGYNAWCLAHFGVDRFLNEMPIYPQNYFGGQSPLCTYLVSLFILTIGRGKLTLFIARLPSLIFNMLGIIFSIKTIHLIFKNKNLTLVCAFLSAILPYLIMQARFGQDCNLMFGCCAIAMYSTFKYVNSQKRADLCLCGVSFGLVMYSYALSYIFVPLCLSLIALYMLYVKKINIPGIILWAVSLCITVLPILLFISSLLLKLDPFKFLFFNIYPVASGRMSEISLQGYWAKVWGSMQLTLTYDMLIVNSIPKYGTMYYISVPFIVVGLFVSLYHFVISLKKRQFHHSVLFLFYYISGLLTMGFFDSNIYRANFFFAAYIYFIILGIHSVYCFLQTYRKPFAIVLTGGYLLLALSFVRFYFTAYKFVVDSYMHLNPYYFVPPVEAVDFADNELCAETVYIDTELSEVYLFFSPVSPYEWTETRPEDNDGYGHYKFRVNSETPITTENAYISRKENIEFISTLNSYDIPYETVEYGDYYYLFYFPE